MGSAEVRPLPELCEHTLMLPDTGTRATLYSRNMTKESG